MLGALWSDWGGLGARGERASARGVGGVRGDGADAGCLYGRQFVAGADDVQPDDGDGPRPERHPDAGTTSSRRGETRVHHLPFNTRPRIPTRRHERPNRIFKSGYGASI